MIVNNAVKRIKETGKCLPKHLISVRFVLTNFYTEPFNFEDFATFFKRNFQFFQKKLILCVTNHLISGIDYS